MERSGTTLRDVGRSGLPERDEPPRRLRRHVSAAAGLGLVLAGASVPFVLGGPFGDDPKPAAAPAGPTDASSSAPSGRSATGTPSAPSGSSSGVTPASLPAAAATSAPPRRTTTTTSAKADRTVSRTASAPAPGSSPTGARADHAGQVYVDPADYVGGQATVARLGLASDGLGSTTTYEYSDTELTGTVLRLSPTGWVALGTDVELTVAL